MTDTRWEHGMDGWRVKIVNQDTVHWGREGEVTGLVRNSIWVVLDGEEEPYPFTWNEVRPA